MASFKRESVSSMSGYSIEELLSGSSASQLETFSEFECKETEIIQKYEGELTAHLKVEFINGHRIKTAIAPLVGKGIIVQYKSQRLSNELFHWGGSKREFGSGEKYQYCFKCIGMPFERCPRHYNKLRLLWIYNQATCNFGKIRYCSFGNHTYGSIMNGLCSRYVECCHPTELKGSLGDDTTDKELALFIAQKSRSCPFCLTNEVSETYAFGGTAFLCTECNVNFWRITGQSSYRLEQPDAMEKFAIAMKKSRRPRSTSPRYWNRYLESLSLATGEDTPTWLEKSLAKEAKEKAFIATLYKQLVFNLASQI